MKSDAAEDGTEVLNALFRDATLKHGSNIKAVLDEVRRAVDGLGEPEREAVSNALEMALMPSDQQH